MKTKKQIIENIAVCAECGAENVPSYQPYDSDPQCCECVDGFWEMMGDDPCGKNWEA